MLWSPEQIAGWLKDTYPNDPSLHVSHETVYRSLFIQARGALKKELLEHLRRTRGMRRSRSSTQKTAMERATKVAKLQLNDYSSIRWAETTESVDQAVAHVKPRKRRLTPEDTGALHQRARAWLAAKLADPFDGPTVVVTSLSGILCVRHTMTNRSMYAKQEEADAAVAGDPPRTH